MQYQNHLYMILHPNPALVGSQYNPEDFAVHYMSGSTRHYSGKVIFAEIDVNYRNDYLKIEKGLEGLVPHDDGSPKATKFISTYRVLEHMDFDAIEKLYLTTPSAMVLGLDPAPYTAVHQPDFIRIFAEITPMRMLVLTKLNFPEFGQYITHPDNPKGVPKIFYTQIDFDIDFFMNEIERNPFMNTPLPSVHSSKLRDAVLELRNNPDKRTKGLSLDSDMNRKSYKYLKHGFMFASPKGYKFFPIPSADKIEEINFKFWKQM